MTPVVRFLLAANVIAFFLQGPLAQLANALVFYPQFVVVRPWTLVTYMFLHGGFTHLLFNMLVLFFFGPRVEERIGSRRFTVLYFLSGIAGALFQLLFSPAPMVGASAGIFGVQLAFAMFWPDTIIHVWGIIPVPMRVMVLATTALAIFSPFIGLGRGIAHFAHLGGYAGAYVYLKWIDRKRGAFRRKAVAPTPQAAVRVEKWKSIDPARVHELNRDEVNRILDKINASGLTSLTPEERLFLSNFVPADDGPIKA